MKTKLQTIEQKYGTFIPYILATIFFVVKWIMFTEKDLAHDEPHAVISAMMPLGKMIPFLLSCNYGILFETLLHFWIKIGGISLEWLRILPLIFSTVTVFFLYKLTKVLGGLSAALIAVVMYVFSTQMHYYGFELRAYSLYAMLALASLWFLLQFLTDQNSQKKTLRYYFAWGFVCLCLVYTHWFSWFFVGFQFFLAFCFFKKQRKSIGLLFVLLLIGFVPAAVGILGHFLTAATQGTFLTPPSWDGFYYTLHHFFNDTRGFAMIAFLICLITFILAMRQKDKKILLVCLSFGLPFFLMFLISFIYPMWVNRYVIFACVGFILMFAISLVNIYKAIKPRWAKVVWLSLCGFLLCYYLISFKADHRKFMYFFDYSGMVEYIHKHEERPFVLVCTNWNIALMHAYHRPLFHNAATGVPFGKYDNFYFLPLWETEHLQAIQETGCDRVIVVDFRSNESEEIKTLLDALAEHYHHQSERQFFSPFYHVQILQKNELSQK